jgi:alpha-amylase
MNKVLMDIIREYGKSFKVAFSITGEAIELLELYAPHALKSFKELAATGSVEFLCETYSHSLAFLKDETEFEHQLYKHRDTIEHHFGKKPVTVRLTGLIYSDLIGEKIAKLGFKTLLTEGAKHVLGWKSPNYVYTNANNPNLKILLRNYQLSHNIAYNFSNHSWNEWPLTSEKFASWLNAVNEHEEVINVFMDYITFGDRHHKSSGIFEFMRYLPKQILEQGKFEFLTPSEISKKHKPVAPVHVPYPISWSEEERDLSIWLGNDLQNDAFSSLCDLANKIRFINNKKLTRNWERLQDSDHYYYMCTKWLIDGTPRRFRNVYSSPYDAYINYMNVLSDLTIRVNNEVQKKIAHLAKNKELSEKINKVISQNETELTPIQINKIMEIEKKSLQSKNTPKTK